MSLLPRLQGQPYARRILEAGFKAGRSASAYLFYGPPGCGKKTAAEDLALALLGNDSGRLLASGNHPDIRLYSPGGATFKVEQVREMLKEASLRPVYGSKRVFILDRVEAMNDSAANALLKGLEEPSDGFTWILVTTQRSKILPTIASRCQAVRFHPLDEATLRQVLEKELKTDPTRAKDLAALSGGSVKQALWLDSEDGKGTLAQAEAFLKTLGTGSLLDRLDWAEGSQGERRSLEPLLSLIWVLLRERWAIAKKLPAELRLLSKAPEHGGSLAPERLEKLMLSVAGAQAALAKNANVALTLDSLVLSTES